MPKLKKNQPLTQAQPFIASAICVITPSPLGLGLSCCSVSLSWNTQYRSECWCLRKEDAKKRFVSGDELCLRRILGISDNNNNIYLAKEQVNHKGKSPSKLHTKNY